MLNFLITAINAYRYNIYNIDVISRASVNMSLALRECLSQKGFICGRSDGTFLKCFFHLLRTVQLIPIYMFNHP